MAKQSKNSSARPLQKQIKEFFPARKSTRLSSVPSKKGTESVLPATTTKVKVKGPKTKSKAKSTTQKNSAVRKRRYLDEVEIDGERFAVGDSAYVSIDPNFDFENIDQPESCQVCGSCELEVAMLECDRCLRGYHLSCLEPPLDSVPKGSWFCSNCASGKPIPKTDKPTTAREAFLAGVGLHMCRIDCLWEENDTYMFTGRWYARPEETHTGRQAHHGAREVFLTKNYDNNQADCLYQTCEVCLPSEYAAKDSGDDVYLCEYEYDTVWQRFRRCSEADKDEDDAEWKLEHDVDDEDRDVTFRPIYEFYIRKGLMAPKNFRGAHPQPLSQKGRKRSSKKQGGGTKWKQLTLQLGASEVPAAQRERAQLMSVQGSELSMVQELLLTSYIPRSLPCREKEKEKIASFVREAVQAGANCVGRCLYVSGVPGTGKTATVMEVMRELRQEAEEGDLPMFQFVEINGLRLPSAYHAYSYLHEALTGENCSPGVANQLLEENFSSCRRGVGSSRVTVLLVDEMDLLITKKQEVLYNLFEWPMRKNSRLAVIGIANTMDLPERLLPRIASRLGNRRLQFQPYTSEQLLTILESRMGELKDVVDANARKFATRKVASVSGDVRRCLDLCRRAAELAEWQSTATQPASNTTPAAEPHKKRTVTLQHISDAWTEMFNSVHIQLLSGAPQLAKVVMAALHLESRATGRANSTLGAVLLRLRTMVKMNSLPEVSCGSVLHVLCVLSSQRLIITDQPCQRLAMQVTLNMSPDDLLYVLNNDSTMQWLQQYMR